MNLWICRGYLRAEDEVPTWTGKFVEHPKIKGNLANSKNIFFTCGSFEIHLLKQVLKSFSCEEYAITEVQML